MVWGLWFGLGGSVGAVGLVGLVGSVGAVGLVLRWLGVGPRVFFGRSWVRCQARPFLNDSI